MASPETVAEKLALVGVLCSGGICFITTLISLQCLSDKKKDCAARSGIIAAVTFMCMCLSVAVALIGHKRR
jgi:cytochrome bd-type quinol oxidase subunit 1